MIVRTDVEPRELPSLMNGIIGIVGLSNWRDRAQALEGLGVRNPLWRQLVRDRYSIELAFEEVRQYRASTGRFPWPPRTPSHYRFYSFMAIANPVYHRLSATGQTRLSGMMRGGLNAEAGLGPLAFELKTAAHFMARDYDVQFHDLENGGGYDFLLTKNSVQVELECKHISGDIGRKIHKRKLCDLGGVLNPFLNDAMQGAGGGILVRVTVPDRLLGQVEYQAALVERITRAITTGAPIIDSMCNITVEGFDIESSAFSALQGQQLTIDAVRDLFCRQFGIDRDHTICKWRPGQRAIIISLKSNRPDKVLSEILSHLKEDARDQFSRQRPATLCVHFADLNQEQLLELREYDRDNVSGIRIATTRLLQSRAHLHTVALMSDGEVRMEQNTAQGIRRTSIRETGPSYIFNNPSHPQADNPELSELFAPWQS